MPGFFYYHDDANEIDMEVLSKDNANHEINFVLQLVKYLADGVTPTKDTLNVTRLPHDLSDDFHTYRFDWLNNVVNFYVDDVMLLAMNSHVPNVGGAVYWDNWSNGMVADSLQSERLQVIID
ncbi:hypothetical protein HDV00_011671 [Rhizophlyctis rosea]|nr:hypothetical protein HDV00_011671 [Rhizophlyctis rosea]